MEAAPARLVSRIRLFNVANEAIRNPYRSDSHKSNGRRVRTHFRIISIFGTNHAAFAKESGFGTNPWRSRIRSNTGHSSSRGRISIEPSKSRNGAVLAI